MNRKKINKSILEILTISLLFNIILISGVSANVVENNNGTNENEEAMGYTVKVWVLDYDWQGGGTGPGLPYAWVTVRNKAGTFETFALTNPRGEVDISGLPEKPSDMIITARWGLFWPEKDRHWQNDYVLNIELQFLGYNLFLKNIDNPFQSRLQFSNSLLFQILQRLIYSR